MVQAAHPSALTWRPLRCYRRLNSEYSEPEQHFSGTIFKFSKGLFYPVDVERYLPMECLFGYRFNYRTTWCSVRLSRFVYQPCPALAGVQAKLRAAAAEDARPCCLIRVCDNTCPLPHRDVSRHVDCFGHSYPDIHRALTVSILLRLRPKNSPAPTASCLSII